MIRSHSFRSAPDGGQFHYLLLAEGDAWGLHLFNETTGHTLAAKPFPSLPWALEQMRIRCANVGTEIDWSSYRFPVATYYAVTREARGEAGPDTTVHRSAADFDTYRRHQLEEHYLGEANFDDAEEVEELLRNGDLQSAWELATSSDYGGKEKTLWETYFGAHWVEEIPVTVAFTDLPEWIQNAAKDSL